MVFEGLANTHDVARRLTALTNLLVTKGVCTEDEITDAYATGPALPTPPGVAEGD